MKIGIMARGLSKGGAARMVKSIIKEIDSSPQSNQFFIITDNQDFAKTLVNVSVVFIKPSNTFIWDYVLLLKTIINLGLDVMIYTKNVIPFTHLFVKTKKMLIITDLAYFDKKLNEYPFKDTVYMKLFMKSSCGFANHIFAISESTRQEIINILKTDANKVSVMYLGVDAHFKKSVDITQNDAVLKKYSMSAPYIFYDGSLSPRKNILNTLIAFKSIMQKIPHNIYLAGGQSWHDSEVLEYIEQNLSDRVKRVGYIPEVDLPILFTCADLYVYPSIYEGFGLPILEAQACGTPVLTTHLTSCKEIAADSAIIVNPYEIQSIANGILDGCLDKQIRSDMINKGLENIKRFSWKKSVDSIQIELAS